MNCSDTAEAFSLSSRNPSEYETGAGPAPELALMRALLFDSVCMVLNHYPRDAAARGSRRVEEALRWIDGTDDHVFSFESVCWYLKIDPEALRNQIYISLKRPQRKRRRRD